MTEQFFFLLFTQRRTAQREERHSQGNVHARKRWTENGYSVFQLQTAY